MSYLYTCLYRHFIFSCSEWTSEELAVEVTFSYPSYKVPKFYVNSLALSSSAARALFPTLADLIREKAGGKPVIIIGVTNRPDSLDQALRIAGRFGREIWPSMADEVRRGGCYPGLLFIIILTPQIFIMVYHSISPRMICLR